MLDNFTDAIKRPFQDGKKLIFGGLLNILPIVKWIASGYTLKCAKLTLNQDNSMPELDNIGSLFLTGLLRAIITFIWCLPSIVFLLIGLGGVILSLLSAFASGSAVNWASLWASLFGVLLFGFIAFIFLIIAAYLLPASILNFVDTERFGAAFDLKKIFSIAFTGEYFVAWLVSWAISFFGVSAVMGVMFPFMFIPYLGDLITMIVFPIVSFVFGIIQITIMAGAYNNLMGVGVKNNIQTTQVQKPLAKKKAKKKVIKKSGEPPPFKV